MSEKKLDNLYKLVVWIIVLSFTAALLCTDIFRVKSSPASQLGLPEPTQLLSLSNEYAPIMLRGIQIHPEDPFRFDFIIDEGDVHLSNEQLKQETSKLINYFLASLAIPEENLWVNLSPYEPDRVIDDQLGETDMGRDMLCQDYILKQLSSSLTHPDAELGQEYWNQISNLESPISIESTAFNKIWIKPDMAKIYEDHDKAFISQSLLKIESEYDYNFLPQLTKELNTGKHFTKVRQMYNALLLATWFKQKLKKHLVNKIYADKTKINGIDLSDKKIKEKVYSQYLKSFEKGVYDFIRKDTRSLPLSTSNVDKHVDKQLVHVRRGQGRVTMSRKKRRYFSGGVDYQKVSEVVGSSVVSWDKKVVSSQIDDKSIKVEVELCAVQENADVVSVC